MVLGSIKAYSGYLSGSKIPVFRDHHLFVHNGSDSSELDTHMTALGIIAPLSGKVILSVNEQKLTLNPTDFLVVNRGSELSLQVSRDSTLALLFFRNFLVDVVAAELLFRNPELSNDLKELQDKTLIEHIHFENASIKDRLELLIKLGASSASFQALKADAVIRALLTDISQENLEAIGISDQLKVVKKSTKVSLYQKLTVAKTWMDRHFMDKIDLQQSAGKAMMNEAHFLRNFKLAFGLTPHQYLMNLRMAESRRLLTSTDKSMTEISETIGFDTLSSFSYQFAKEEGLSPTAYRKRLLSE